MAVPTSYREHALGDAAVQIVEEL